jgi:phosphate transport system protein
VVREVFHGELAQLGAELSGAVRIAATQMQRAMTALLEVDLRLAERVITDDDELDQLGRHIERHASELLALQSPVARDLRTVVCAIRVGERVERMGDLARHVAELVRLRHPQPAAPAGLADQFAEMGQLAVQACLALEDAIAAPHPSWRASDLADDRLDRLQREILDAVSTAEPPYPVQVGVDVALLTRYLERFGDQAVSITGQLDYVATGKIPSRPNR